MEMNSSVSQKRLLVGVVVFMLAFMAVGVLIAFLGATERHFLLIVSSLVESPRELGGNVANSISLLT
jgi:hypothetical protein